MKKTIKKTQSKIKILFLCTGNTCRSPMAEQIFKDYLRKIKLLSKFDVKSAGLFADTGGHMSDYAGRAVEGLGIKLKNHIPRQFNKKLAESLDIIICVTEKHKNMLDGNIRNKSFSLAEITGGRELADPYGLGYRQYDMAAEYLFYACKDIFEFIQKKLEKEN